jgi:quercetin dioxygenase-like cupin family protein
VRTTIFTLVGDRVETTVNATPEWRPFEEFDGKPLDRVRLVELVTESSAEVQLVEIAARGSFAMHSSPKIAFCQVVRGKGKLGLPDGRELAYEGPELYVFLPNTLHDWHEIERDTLLSVCLVDDAQRAS